MAEYISFQPSDHYNTKLYTGTGAELAITGVGFQPDLVWVKNRDSANSHQLYDAVRGTTKYIESDNTTVELTSSDGITTFGADGFTLGGNLTGANNSGDDFASWNWKANGSGSANTDGAINSTVSANTTSGFSIVSYTGTLSGNGNTTVGHGLGAVPKMIITKSKSNAENWGVYHKDLTANHILQLNTTSAQINTTSEGTVTAPTSSVFTVNYRGEYGNSGQNYIAYCFAEKKGYSKFGSYTGNTSTTDGPFSFCGFRPNFVLIKNTADAEAWQLFDGKRAGYNAYNYRLYPNNTSAEATSTNYIDLLSNGFKIRTGSGSTAQHDVNSSGKLFIYAAFAEFPLVSSNDIPVTAR